MMLEEGPIEKASNDIPGRLEPDVDEGSEHEQSQAEDDQRAAVLPQIDPEAPLDPKAGRTNNEPAPVSDDKGQHLTTNVVLDQDLEKAQVVPSNERPYSTFSPWQKKTIVLAASFGSFISPLTTNIYFPALNTIASDLGVSIGQINLTITTYMVSPMDT